MRRARGDRVAVVQEKTENTLGGRKNTKNPETEREEGETEKQEEIAPVRGAT